MASLKSGLKPLFSSAQIQKVLTQKAEDFDRKTVLALKFLGEKFVTLARLEGNYTDRTGNLRSSIGYVVLNNGRIESQNFLGKSGGVTQAKEYVNELKAKYNQGFVLIGVAGMKYAAYVEAKNFDVITGSAPNESIVKTLFNEIDF